MRNNHDQKSPGSLRSSPPKIRRHSSNNGLRRSYQMDMKNKITPFEDNSSSSNPIPLKQIIPIRYEEKAPEFSFPTRSESIHPRRGAPNFKVEELMRLDPMAFFFCGFIPPMIGAVGSIIVALTFHNDEISNYNWQCGRARLPSLSRIINLPMERIFWQFTFLFHIPLRCVELGVGFFRYGRLRSVECKSPRLYTFSRYMYVILGILELIFMIALSVVGEREFIQYHVIFFYLFGMFATGFFIANVVCHANSLYFLNPYGRLSYKIKIIVTILYFVSIPILFGAFVLYWKKCITFMYDIFAITEYVDVFLSIIYHSCAFYDIRHKVIFSIRHVKSIKRD